SDGMNAYWEAPPLLGLRRGFLLCAALEGFFAQTGAFGQGDRAGIAAPGKGDFESVATDARDTVQLQQKSIFAEPAAFAGKGQIDQGIGGEAEDAIQAD